MKRRKAEERGRQKEQLVSSSENDLAAPEPIQRTVRRAEQKQQKKHEDQEEETGGIKNKKRRKIKEEIEDVEEAIAASAATSIANTSGEYAKDNKSNVESDAIDYSSVFQLKGIKSFIQKSDTNNNVACLYPNSVKLISVCSSMFVKKLVEEVILQKETQQENFEDTQKKKDRDKNDNGSKKTEKVTLIKLEDIRNVIEGSERGAHEKGGGNGNNDNNNDDKFDVSDNEEDDEEDSEKSHLNGKNKKQDFSFLLEEKDILQDIVETGAIGLDNNNLSSKLQEQQNDDDNDRMVYSSPSSRILRVAEGGGKRRGRKESEGNDSNIICTKNNINIKSDKKSKAQKKISSGNRNNNGDRSSETIISPQQPSLSSAISVPVPGVEHSTSATLTTILADEDDYD